MLREVARRVAEERSFRKAGRAQLRLRVVVVGNGTPVYRATVTNDGRTTADDVVVSIVAGRETVASSGPLTIEPGAEATAELAAPVPPAADVLVAVDVAGFALARTRATAA